MDRYTRCEKQYHYVLLVIVATMEVENGAAGILENNQSPALTKYPYEIQRPIIPTFRDPYQRPAASLLQSIRIYTKRIIKSTATIFPITINDTDIGLDDVKLAWRLCSSKMTKLDYLAYLERYTTESSRKRVTVLHVDDILQKDQVHIFDELPNVSLYQEVLLSTLSTTHKLVVYLIVPGTCTLNVYVTSPGEDDGINEITSKLLAVLRTYLHHDYSIVDRLPLQRTFHNDSFFFALLLIFQLHKHGGYLFLSEETIFQYKLSFVVNFIHLHDQYLGRLNIERLSSRPYPFYTTQFDVTTESDEDTNKFKLLEQKGWHVMDVKGDGNCGYYALLLALLNTGIDE